MLRLLLTTMAALAAMTAQVLSAPRLELTLAPTKQEFVLGEAVVVVVRLANIGDEPVTLQQHLRPEFANVRFTIAEGDTPGGNYAPWAIKDPVEPFATLLPGKSFEEVVDLFYDARGWVFREPGIWTVEAVYAQSVRAERLRLSMATPREKGESEAAAALLASSEAGRFLLLRGGDHLREGMDVLERVTREWPETPHATLADLALSLNLLRPFADYASGRLRPANPAAAAERLERVQDRPLDPQRTVEATLALAAAYRQLGRVQLADELEAGLDGRLRQRFPSLAPGLLDSTVTRVRHQLPPG